MLLLPVFIFVAAVIVVVGIGAPGRAEVIVPLIVPPPADAFQDLGIIRIAGTTGLASWLVRIVAALGRIGVVALFAALAAQRSAGAAASIPEARAALRGRGRTLILLGATSFGFALLVAQRGALDPGRQALVAATALTAGMLVLPGAVIAASTLGAGYWRSLRLGLAPRRPLGHAAIVIGYSASVNGLYRLATFGEVGRPQALPVTLYGIATALLTAVMIAALTRRYLLLVAPGHGKPAPSPRP